MLERDCVHCFTQGGKFFVVDGNSGAVHQLDTLSYMLVQQMVQGATLESAAEEARRTALYAAVDIQEASAELGELIAEGLLFSADVLDVLPRQNSVVKALCLNVAHDCNLRCTYCFADTGNFGHQRELMRLAVAKQAVDFLIQGSGSRKQLEIDFFGGEPLLNFEVVKDTVLYGEEQGALYGKQIRFTITTNGMGLTKEIMDFCNEKMYNVVLSIDGRQEVNDKARYTPNGRGSVYQTIVPKYQEFVASRKGKSYYVRGTFTRANLDFTQDVIHLADLGFEQLSLEPVVAAENLPYALTEAELPAILREYDTLAEVYLARYLDQKPFNFFHFNVELKKGPCLYKRLSGCGAGHEYLAVTPDGELYPCHQFIGQPEYKLGDVATGLVNKSLGEKLQDAHVLHKPECRKCWAKYYCSGGCHANNLKFNKDVRIPYGVACTMEQKRLECSFYIHAVVHENAGARADENVV